MQAAERILVLGVGNILMKDDGVGVHAVKELEKKDLPGNVDIMDAGTAVIDIVTYLKGVRKLVVIDAVRAGGDPGTIYRFAPEEAYDNNKMSLHQMGLLETLTMAKEMGMCPEEVVVIGVEPEQVKPELELTEKISRKIPEIINAVIKEVKGG